MMRELTVQKFHQYLQASDTDVQLLDVREEWEFALTRLPNSILIPLAQIPGRVNELKPTVVTVVICHHGIRSRVAVRFLEQNGFSQVINLTGGIDAWSKQIDETVPVY